MARNPAAVLLGILDRNIVLTKRAAGLRTFTGHVCLPGGQMDAGDNGIVGAAIREFNEEVYFTGSIEPVFCLLPEVSVVTSQAVYPLIAYLDGKIKGFNEDEVQKLFLLPFNELHPEKFRINPDYPQIKHNKCFTHDGELIWGLTAHILYNFTCNYQGYF